MGSGGVTVTFAVMFVVTLAVKLVIVTGDAVMFTNISSTTGGAYGATISSTTTTGSVTTVSITGSTITTVSTISGSISSLVN